MSKGPKLKLDPFDTRADRLQLGRSFERWLERFERELRYNGVKPAEKPEMAQMALLIYAGTEVEDIHETLPNPTKPESVQDVNWTCYEVSKTKLLNYFSPKKCNDFAIHELVSIKMNSDETVESFALRLRKAAEKCDFADWSAAKMIKALLISNMRDTELRQKLLQKERTLDEILDIARKKADATERGKILDNRGTGESSGIHKTDYKKKQPYNRQPEVKGRQCGQCGYETHKGPKSTCPAIGRECKLCKITGHFASMCRSQKPVQRIDPGAPGKESDSDTEDSDGYKSNVI